MKLSERGDILHREIMAVLTEWQHFEESLSPQKPVHNPAANNSGGFLVALANSSRSQQLGWGCKWN